MSATGTGFTEASYDSARAFRAILDAMARPGRIVTLSGAEPPAGLSRAAATVLLTLADGTTPVYLAGAAATDAVADWLRFHTGAPLAEPRAATFAVGSWAALQPLDRFPFGEPAYPDRSATLIVELDRLEAEGAVLRGPGIYGRSSIFLPETRFFEENRALFPLGLDVILTCGDRLAAIPRSTIVEAV